MTCEFHPPARILMGPGPSNADPRVLLAMAKPLVGHLDPEFIKIMDNIKNLLEYTFSTQNVQTLPISGTGSAGMEAAFVNVVEPGDRVLICVGGVFGERMVEVAERCGANLRTLSAPWGQPFEPALIEKELRSFEPKVLAIVHAETSTGVLQPPKSLVHPSRPQGRPLGTGFRSGAAGMQSPPFETMEVVDAETRENI